MPIIPTFNIWLLEDEDAAAERLSRMIEAQKLPFKVHRVIATVREAIEQLQGEEKPDLIFSDIELADGNAFEAFTAAKPNCPIIFTTAYDSYGLTAIRHHGLAYLLKPIREQELNKAMQEAMEQINTHQKASMNVRELKMNFARLLYGDRRFPKKKEDTTTSASDKLYPF